MGMELRLGSRTECLNNNDFHLHVGLKLNMLELQHGEHAYAINVFMSQAYGLGLQ